VLKNRLSPPEIEAVLREVGRAVAADASGKSNDNFETRVQNALKVLEAIGGSAEVEKHGDKIVIRGNGCPLAAAVTVHPEVCHLAETLVSEVVKAPVTERCDREGRPSCRFEISLKEAHK
jgi:predicted ArsR family transcriptional regulator